MADTKIFWKNIKTWNSQLETNRPSKFNISHKLDRQREIQKTRTKEHLVNFRLNHTEKSAIALQFLEHRTWNWLLAILLKSVNRKNELVIWEKYLSTNMHMTLWILKSHLRVLSLKRPPDGTSMASTSIAANAWYNTPVDLNWEWVKHRLKQLSSR